MGKLFTFSPERFQSIASASLQDVAVTNLFYLYNGRNAWHSTWVTQYSEGCMHSDLRSAQQSAERQRTQGAVFYISSLPALLFQSAAGFLAVTQINTFHPLLGYSSEATADKPSSGAELIEGSRDCYIEKGAPMHGVALSFNLNSRFWVRRPVRKNSVVVVATEEIGTTFSTNEQNDPTKLRSYSNGSAYALGWRRVEAAQKISFENVREIAARFVK